jgi:hypothetical protein
MTRITICSSVGSYYLRRASKVWCGRIQGWQPYTGTNMPKRYTRLSGARAAAAIIQCDEREARDAKRLQAAAPALLEALDGLMQYVGGWDETPDHPCGIARDLLRKVKGVKA